jgi:preprotein translocase subunit YajC
MAAIFYLLILRPQQRAKKAKLEMAAALEIGSQVLTVGGIFGTVAELRDEDFDLEIAPGVIMRMDRRAIATVIRDTTDDVDDDDASDDAQVDDDHEDDDHQQAIEAGDETSERGETSER